MLSASSHLHLASRRGWQPTGAAACALVCLCAWASLSSGCHCNREEPCLSASEARFCDHCFDTKLSESIWCPYGLFKADTPVDLRRLHGFENLEDLDLAGRNVTDLSPLAQHQGLRHLNLLNTHVRDLRPIARLRRLETLDIGNSQVTSLAPLRDLHMLRVLHVTGTQVADLSPLSGLAKLTELHVDWTRVKDLRPLSTLKQLEVIWVTRGALDPAQLEQLRRSAEHIEIIEQEPRW